MFSAWTITPCYSSTSATTEIAWGDLEHIKHDYMTLGVRVKSAMVQVVFSSILLVIGSRKNGQIRDLLERIPEETVLQTRVIKESWLIFKDYLLRVQE